MLEYNQARVHIKGVVFAFLYLGHNYELIVTVCKIEQKEILNVFNAKHFSWFLFILEIFIVKVIQKFHIVVLSNILLRYIFTK